MEKNQILETNKIMTSVLFKEDLFIPSLDRFLDTEVHSADYSTGVHTATERMAPGWAP